MGNQLHFLIFSFMTFPYHKRKQEYDTHERQIFVSNSWKYLTPVQSPLVCNGHWDMSVV